MEGNSFLSWDSYAHAGFSVILKRSSIPYYVNTYLPTTILTLVSFIGFLLPVEREEGRRMALLITILLMMVTISGIQQQNGPVVFTNTDNPYAYERVLYKFICLLQTRNMTALDTWILMCTSFVALATLEYATVVAIKFCKRDTIQNNGCNKQLNKMCRKIDHLALAVFMVAFLLSVSVYILVVIKKSHVVM